MSAGPPGASFGAAVAPDGSQLYVFGSRTPQSLYTYAIDGGALTLLGIASGPVASSAGLAAN